MNTIYSHSEESYMKRMQERKARWFGPLARALSAAGISANAVSAFSAVLAVVGAALAVRYGNEWLFVIAIWLHFVLDGLDGTLARLHGSASRAGLLWDLAADSAGIASLGYILIAFDITPHFLGLLFTIPYLLVNLLSAILMFRGKRYPFVIRPRLYIFCAITVQLILGWEFTFYIAQLMIFAAALILWYFTVKGIVLLFREA